MGPSNLGLILFVLALAKGATVVLQIGLKVSKARETQAWLSACCWMRLKPTQSDGSVSQPTPNPLISLLGDRLSGKILCVYNEKCNPFFHMDYRQWYKSCRRRFFFQCTEGNKGKMEKKKIGQRGKVNKKTHVTDMPLQVQYCLVKAFSTLKTDHLTCWRHFHYGWAVSNYYKMWGKCQSVMNCSDVHFVLAQ